MSRALARLIDLPIRWATRLPGSGKRDAGVLLSGYATQLYGAVVSLAFAPVILQAVGPEGYGLVGVFLMVQAAFQLLDAGMTPALTRETARFSGGAVDGASLAHTTRGLELIVLASALPLIVLSFLLSDRLAAGWLTSETLEVSEVAAAFRFMAAILVVRWLSGIWRGLLIGFERHVQIHALTFLVATLRFPGIVLLFNVVDPSPFRYFAWQLLISLCEAALVWWLSRRSMPRGHAPGAKASLRSLRRIGNFALTHAALAIVWVLILQTDKYLLSRHLPLAEFGYFTLAVAAAAGINLIAVPLAQMLKPRLTRLQADNDVEGVRSTYRLATRVAMVSVSGIGAVFLLFGREVLTAWTGEATIAAVAGPVLSYYALGNIAMMLGSFAYYLQYARGDLSLHTWGTLGKLAFIVPAMYWAVTAHGLRGSAMMWAAFWILHLLSWIWYTHRVFLTGLEWRWLGEDVLRPFLPALALAALARQALAVPDSRLASAALLLGLIVLCSLASLIGASLIGTDVLGRLRARRTGGTRS